MKSISRDPVINAINNGIKLDIETALNNDRYRAAIILIYAGMDAMAYLDMPTGQTEVRRNDFIKWSGKYIKFPCKEQLNGEDMYGARCAMLHAYGVESRMSNARECRMIGYMDKGIPEVRYNPAIKKDLVMVSIPGLKDAFFAGIDKFLIDSYSNKIKIPVVEERLKKFVLYLPSSAS